jgi:hypothetical protein
MFMFSSGNYASGRELSAQKCNILKSYKRTSKTNNESLSSALVTLISRHLIITRCRAAGYCDVSFINSLVNV